MRSRPEMPPITCHRARRIVLLAELGLAYDEIAASVGDGLATEDIEWTLWILGWDPAKRKRTERILRELDRERRCVGGARSSLPGNDVLLAAWDLQIGRKEGKDDTV